ncbi:hypothetical protein H920_02166 [Fukomys damarensis]|uniref:Uncharacterized protein n=1 Tax=Fukomys damarensis TaxID=885580 RepID=A0A091DZA4_FUKDA|nr:hypothetical protein H920_02166 [Fukomys damarensis]
MNQQNNAGDQAPSTHIFGDTLEGSKPYGQTQFTAEELEVQRGIWIPATQKEASDWQHRLLGALVRNAESPGWSVAQWKGTHLPV